MEKRLCLLLQQNGDRAYPFRYLYYQEYLLGKVAHCNKLNSDEAAGLFSVVRDYTYAQDVLGQYDDAKQGLALMKKDKLSEVPVVLFTTSSSEPDKSLAARHGVDLLTKPIKHGELYESVKRLLLKCMR